MYPIFGLQPAEHASSATNCGPPPGGGCGPLGPDGPIPTRDKPAAERTGLRRRGAALRPGAAAGCRSQSDRFRWQTLPPEPMAAAPDEQKQCCGLPVAARPNSPPKKTDNSRADEQRRPPGEPSPFPENTAARVQLRTFTFLFLTFTASPSIELPCTEITSRPPSELE